MAFDGRLLAGVGVLTAVVEGGGFGRAADALGITASGVSRAIQRLEARVGARLLDRTTRTVALSEEGRRFYERVKPLLDSIEEAAADAAGAKGAVRGRLRVNLDPLVSRTLLGGKLGRFLALHPEVSLELVTQGRIGDLVGDGMDVAVRYDEPKASSLVARKLLETRILTFASPRYLARHGRPKHPDELLGHACIHFRDPQTGQPFAWEFHQGRKIVEVPVASRLVMSDAGAMIEECLAGAGVAQGFENAVRDLIERGRLVNLFPDWSDEVFPLYALYPSRHHPPAKVRAFIDFVREAVA
ncbi:MAG TPA: LysR family transcriptional regulator [Dongiaceae bacterium]|nr:LysR family transcriptional regulator [Dongiaceae bacterium]